MEDMASLWSYQECIDDLKQKLLYTSLELEAVRIESSEELRKNKECMKQLFQLLKIACHERDEARDQLQKLLQEFMSSTTAHESSAAFPRRQPESPIQKPTKANSSITESNSLSETHKSHGSSPVNSLLDGVSSPELSTVNVADSRKMAFVNHLYVQDFNGTVSTSVVSSGTPKIDRASMAIDNLVKGKTLPWKGKLLQAVLEAGPLLQTLLVAGPLPQWRNPPPLQPFQIPPVSMNGCDVEIACQNLAANPSHVAPKPLNSSPYVEMSCGSSQMLSTSMLNFASGSSGSCLSNGRLTPADASTNSYIPTGKRQRIH